MEAGNEELSEDRQEGGDLPLEGPGDKDVEDDEQADRAVPDDCDQGAACEEDEHEDIDDTPHQEDRVVHVLGGVREIDIVYDGVVGRHELWLVKLIIVGLQDVHEKDRQVDHANLEGDGHEAGHQGLQVCELHVVNVQSACKDSADITEQQTSKDETVSVAELQLLPKLAELVLVSIVSLKIPNHGVDTEHSCPKNHLFTRQIEEVAILMVVFFVSVIEFGLDHYLGTRWGNAFVKDEVGDGSDLSVDCLSKTPEEGRHEAGPVD